MCFGREIRTLNFELKTATRGFMSVPDWNCKPAESDFTWTNVVNSIQIHNMSAIVVISVSFPPKLA